MKKHYSTGLVCSARPGMIGGAGGGGQQMFITGHSWIEPLPPSKFDKAKNGAFFIINLVLFMMIIMLIIALITK